MRAFKSLLCAAAILACLAPGARADEYTKQTFLTFSGPVQLPGITLAAGTYQFKLADPDSGRQVLQVWDKEGTKLYTTLLTIPDRRMTPTDEPVVMFAETPSGQPQAIRAWFYPTEVYGQEFVYPKDQAMKIAQATHEPVLAFDEDAKDEAAMKTAKVGRVDEKGMMTDADKASSTTTADASASQPAPAASTTADNASRDAAAATTATASPSPAPMPSANRTESPAAVGTSGTTVGNTTSEANRDNTNVNQRAVGATGSRTGANANATAQAPSNANAAPRRELPRTAGSTALVSLLAGLSLAGAFGLRRYRTQAAQSR